MACKARHDLAPMKPHLHQYSSPTCPCLDALTWVPPLSMTALCTWMLSPSLHKENLHSACRCQLFHEGSPDSSSKQTASLFVRKYFLTKYFILTFPFHYSAFTTLYGNYLAFLLPPWVQWQFLLCLCTLQCLSSDLTSSTFSTSIWWLNRSSRTRTPISEYSFSAYTNTAGYLKTKQFIVWQRLREVNMNIINCRASQNL